MGSMSGRKVPRFARALFCTAGAISAAYFLLLAVVGMLLRHSHAPLMRRGLHHFGAAPGNDTALARVFSALLFSAPAGFLLDVLAVFWIAAMAALGAMAIYRWIRRDARSVAMPDRPEIRPAMQAMAAGGGHAFRRSGKVIQFRRR
jgi:hypothetical protein